MVSRKVRANLLVPILTSGAAADPLRWRVGRNESAMVGLGSCFVVLRIGGEASPLLLNYWTQSSFSKKYQLAA